MSDIPQVEDQFIEEADSAEELVSPRFTPSLTGRFPIYVSEEVCVDELRVALNAAGFAMISHAEGWCVDKVHAIALVKEPANESVEEQEEQYPLVQDAEGRN